MEVPVHELTTEQSMAVCCRMVYRAVPLIKFHRDAEGSEIAEALSNLMDFCHHLSLIAIGNVTLEEAKASADSFRSRVDISSVVEGPYRSLASAFCLITNTLGDSSEVKYHTAAGASEYSLKNPESRFVLIELGQAIEVNGVLPEVADNVVADDCRFIFRQDSAYHPAVDPKFFSRPLWPALGDNIEIDGFSPPVMSVLFDEWVDAASELGLSGAIYSYKNVLSGFHVVSENFPRKEKTVVQNNVTLTFDNGSKFEGPLVVGNNIKAAFSGAREAADSEKRLSIEALIETINDNLGEIESDAEKEKITAALEAFVNEAKKDQPNESLLQVLSGSIVSGVKDVANFVKPVAGATAAVLALLS